MARENGYSNFERFLEEYERDFEGLKGLRWIWWMFMKIGGDEEKIRQWEEIFESMDQVRIDIQFQIQLKIDLWSCFEWRRWRTDFNSIKVSFFSVFEK